MRMGCRRCLPGGHVVGVVVCALAVLLGSFSAHRDSPLSVQLAQAGGSPVTASAVIGPADMLDLLGLEKHFQAVAQTVAPTVVAISASTTPVDSESALRSEELNPQRLDTLLNRTTRTVGTGFIIDSDGYILTNEHVIAEAAQLWVTLDSGKVYPAIVIGSDPRADLAMLKIPARGLPVAEFQTAPVRRGQWAIALGNPYGLASAGEMAMSVGIISATDRSLPKLASRENRLYTNLIQTTAQINPGNSGGPLFDIHGKVIGISTAVILPQKQTNGIGFAIPYSEELLEKIRMLKQGGEVVYGYLGVMVSTPSERERRVVGLDASLGARIDTVEPGSPADPVLRVGDYVLEVSGRPVHDSDHFVRLIGRSTVEQPTELKIVRDGTLRTVKVQLRKRQLPTVAVHRDNVRLRWRGMVLGPVPSHWSSGGSVQEGGVMVVNVDPNSPFAAMGITPGTVIQRVAGQTIRSLADLQRVINDTPAEHCSVELPPPPGPMMVTSGRD